MLCRFDQLCTIYCKPIQQSNNFNFTYDNNLNINKTLLEHVIEYFLSQVTHNNPNIPKELFKRLHCGKSWISFLKIIWMHEPPTETNNKWLSLSPHLYKLLNDASDLWLEAHVQHSICLGERGIDGIVFKSKWFLSNAIQLLVQMVLFLPFCYPKDLHESC